MTKSPTSILNMLEASDKKELMQIYEVCKKSYSQRENHSKNDWEELNQIFQIAIEAPKSFFPNKTCKTVNAYIERWIKGYFKAKNNPPSRRSARPKSVCTDPAIKTIVKKTQNLTEKAATLGEENHNLFMSAENVQGNLLEEYIASKIRQYGFLWCQGNILDKIDFCNTSGTCFIQVKNKSNTENSSSSSVRHGTSIKHWYRLGTKTLNKRKLPTYEWEKLNNIINDNKTCGFKLPKCNLSEKEYMTFLEEKASANKNLITKL